MELIEVSKEKNGPLKILLNVDDIYNGHYFYYSLSSGHASGPELTVTIPLSELKVTKEALAALKIN